MIGPSLPTRTSPTYGPVPNTQHQVISGNTEPQRPALRLAHQIPSPLSLSPRSLPPRPLVGRVGSAPAGADPFQPGPGARIAAVPQQRPVRDPGPPGKADHPAVT
jgi:hypothetical protein